MDGLIQILTFLALSGTTVAFTPDTPNSESFGESELFPQPVASFHSDGFVMGYHETDHTRFGSQDLVNMDIARGFSLKRWQLGGTNILELGGGIGAYHQFTRQANTMSSNDIDDLGSLSLLSREYLVSANLGYLTNGLIMRLIWEANRRETERAFLPLAQDATGNDVLAGDSWRLFFGDIGQVMRYYVSYGRFLHLERTNQANLKRDFAYWGAEARFFDDSSQGLKLIVGFEQRGYAYNNWNISNRARIGIESSSTPIRGWRLLLDWSKGQAEYAADHTAEATTTGILFQRLF